MSEAERLLEQLDAAELENAARELLELLSYTRRGAAPALETGLAPARETPRVYGIARSPADEDAVFSLFAGPDAPPAEGRDIAEYLSRGLSRCDKGFQIY